MPVIRQKGESQNGCFKKTKHAKFSEKRTFLTLWYTHVCTRTCAYQGVRNVRFPENLACFFFYWNTRFEISLVLQWAVDICPSFHWNQLARKMILYCGWISEFSLGRQYFNFSPFDSFLLWLFKHKTEEQNQDTITKLISVKSKIEKRVLSRNYYKTDYNSG